MTVRRGSVLAIATLVAFLACTVLGLQHAANVQHVRDASSGEVTHAPHTGCRDGAVATHIHSLPASQDHEGDACRLIAATHSLATCAAAPRTLIALRMPAVTLAIVDTTSNSSAPLLRFAPKTSPPDARPT